MKKLTIKQLKIELNRLVSDYMAGYYLAPLYGEREPQIIDHCKAEAGVRLHDVTYRMRLDRDSIELRYKSRGYYPSPVKKMFSIKRELKKLTRDEIKLIDRRLDKLLNRWGLKLENRERLIVQVEFTRLYTSKDWDINDDIIEFIQRSLEISLASKKTIMQNLI